jgi:hypothetical protein
VNKPFLKQIGELTEADFKRVPIWVSCHVVDYDEPWYDETDEETVRPWTSSTPVDPSTRMLIVKANFILVDGTEYVGFLTPTKDVNADGSPDLGVVQPRVFASGHLFGFWGGMFGIPEDVRAASYAAVGKNSQAVFPLRVSAAPGLVQGGFEVDVRGFYSNPDLKGVKVEV